MMPLFYFTASIDWIFLRMNLSRSWGKNSTLPLRMRKASTGWINASSLTDMTWWRESLAEQSWVLSCQLWYRWRTVTPAVQRKDTCGEKEVFTAAVSLNVYNAKAHPETAVVQGDFDYGCIALDIFIISVLSGIEWRRQHFPLWKFLHFAFHCILVTKEVDHGSEAHGNQN